MARKGLGYSLKRELELLTLILAHEQAGRELSYLDLQNLLGVDYKTVARYVDALEKAGLVQVEPKVNKNVVRLTDRGRCIARCLVS